MRPINKYFGMFVYKKKEKERREKTDSMEVKKQQVRESVGKFLPQLKNKKQEKNIFLPWGKRQKSKKL